VGIQAVHDVDSVKHHQLFQEDDEDFENHHHTLLMHDDAFLSLHPDFYVLMMPR